MKVGDLIYDTGSREKGIITSKCQGQPTIGTRWLVFFGSGCRRYCHSSKLEVISES